MKTVLNSPVSRKRLRVRKVAVDTALSSPGGGEGEKPESFPARTHGKAARRDTLSLAWIDQHLELAAFHKDTQVTPIYSFENIVGIGELGQCLARFIDQTGFRGRQAQCVIDGEPLASATESLPPSKPRQQKLYLRQKARRIELESKPIIWESQGLASSKKSPKCLMHYISRAELDELARLFQRRQIALTHLTPASSLATKAIKRLLGKIDAPTLVAIRAGAGTKLFAVDSDEQLEFVRALNVEGSGEGERGAIEVNRCLLYARQQFGQPIERLALVGDALTAARESIRQLLGQTVSIVHFQSDQALWLKPIARLAPINLAKEGMLKRRYARLRQASVLAAYASLSAACLHYAYGAEQAWKAAKRDIARLSAAESSMESILQTQGEVQARAERLERFIANTERLDRPPVERALLAYLSRALPRDLWLQELEIAWNPADQIWNVRLLVQSESRISEVVAMGRQLQRSLEESPLRFQLRHSTIDSLSRVIIQGSGPALQTVAIEGDIAP